MKLAQRPFLTQSITTAVRLEYFLCSEEIGFRPPQWEDSDQAT